MNEFHEEDEDYFCRFTFGQFISLALLEVVALFFVFYLGARYGPAMIGGEAPVDKNPLASTEEELKLERTPTNAEIKYTFPKELTRKETLPEPVTPTIEQLAKAKPAIPAKPEKARSRRGYSIQVGSYRQAGGAAAKVNQWQAKGYDAFLSIGEVANSGTWYRVRIGSFKTREGARKFLDQLSQREKVAAIIVRSNT